MSAHALPQGIELGEKLKCCWSIWGYSDQVASLRGQAGRMGSDYRVGGVLLSVDSEGGCPFMDGSSQFLSSTG